MKVFIGFNHFLPVAYKLAGINCSILHNILVYDHLVRGWEGGG